MVSALSGGWWKGVIGVFAGLFSGAAAVVLSPIVDYVAKPTKPVANFSVTSEGLTVTCQNEAAGNSGWWDFGDGTSLEPFSPQEPTVTHRYTKPGNYQVKLVVRNGFGDENERSVPVDLNAATNTSASPEVVKLNLVPISPLPVAPATYRVVAETRHAEACIWDWGDGRPLEVASDTQQSVERLVAFEKPGNHVIQLTAWSGKQAVKRTASVEIFPPQAGSLMVVFRVTDLGQKVDSRPVVQTIPISVPHDLKQPQPFEKVVNAQSGYNIVDAPTPTSNFPGVRNLKVQVSADKRSVKLTGEVIPMASGDKQKSGTEAMVPLKMTQERIFAASPATVLVTGPLSRFGGSIEVPLPAVPKNLRQHQRQFALEIRDGDRVIWQDDGGGKGVNVPFSSPINWDRRLWSFKVTSKGDRLGVEMLPLVR